MPSEDAEGRYAFTRIAPFPLVEDIPYDQACRDAADALFHDIEGFHKHIIERYGGLPGWKDRTMLLAATQRPFASAYGVPAYPSGLEQAAALLHSVVNNHAFVDANKRTAYYACCYFLSVCGYWRHHLFLNRIEAVDMERLVLDLARAREDLQARRITDPYTIEQIAARLDRTLAGSRNRHVTYRRMRSGGYRPLGILLDR